MFPGAVEAIDALERNGIVLGIATGKSRQGLAHVLEQTGLSGQFATLHTADAGPGKPHLAMLLAVMATVDVLPARAVMVRDTVFDITMATAPSVSTALASYGDIIRPPNCVLPAGARYVIDTFICLAHIVDQLLER